MAKKTKEKEDKKIHISGLKGGQRIKAVEGEMPAVVSQAQPASIQEATARQTKKARVKKLRGKKYASMRAKVDRNKSYDLADAIKLVKDTSFSKFDGTVEIHLSIKKHGFSINVNLPHGIGREKKIEFADEATIEKLKSGKIDFDVLLATSEMMPKLVPYARLLGPKGMMPNPKNGTLVKDKSALKKFSGNSLTIKTEKEAPLIHTVAGKVSMEPEKLKQNIEAIFAAIGINQIIKAFIKPTMGPSVKIKV